MSGERPAAGASTRLAGLIGDPVTSSRSPAIHNAAFAACGIDACYLAFEVRAGAVPAAIAGAGALSMLGLSVTMPHKAAAAAAAFAASPEVEVLGVANTIVFRAGVAVAHNTDGAGFIDDLARRGGPGPEGARCAVIGTGGAAAAVVLALGAAGAADIVVIGRSPERAEAVARLHGAARTGPLTEAGGAALVVHATPLGMTPARSGPDERGALDTIAAVLGPGQLLVDLITSAPTTPLMAAAARRGCAVRNGIGMLVHQAAHQFELFTGEAAPLDAMWAAVAAEA